MITAYFSLSERQSRAFLLLLLVSLAALALIFFPEMLITRQREVDPADVRKLDSLVMVMEKSKTVTQEPFVFDPNTLSADSLMLLGLPESIARRLVNYREKGGTITIKSDLKKIYDFPPELYEKLVPYIRLPERKHEKIAKFSLDINKATPGDLERIPGLSRSLAGRIVKYRDLLGGYIDKQQLVEVYGLTGKTLENVQSVVFIIPGFVPRRIKINKASVGVLKSHPYIPENLAEDVVRYRKINGKIESKKVLARFKSIDEHNFEKLIPYLDFE